MVNWKNLVMGIVYITLLYSATVIMHEATHGVIYEKYGCENISYGFWDMADNESAFSALAYTTAECQNQPTEIKSSMYLAHSINEIVGYNLVMPLLLIVYLLITKE